MKKGLIILKIKGAFWTILIKFFESRLCVLLKPHFGIKGFKLQRNWEARYSHIITRNGNEYRNLSKLKQL